MTHPTRSGHDSSPRSAATRRGLWLTLALLLVVLAVAVARRERGRRPPLSTRPAVGLRTTDPFTSIPRDTVPIAWHEWSAETFVTARAADAPVVALLDVDWSESCALYAAALAADPQARAALENGVIAVRVDADRRPDVHARYCLENSTLPTWILLAPTGETWAVTDALPPAALVRRIAELRAAPHPTRPDPGLEMLRRLQPVPPATPDLEALPDRLLASLQAEWPPPLTPITADSPLLEWDALEFVRVAATQRRSPALRALYVDMVRRLAASVDSSGSVVQEILPVPGRILQGRFLVTHAMLLDHFLKVARSPGDTSCARAAERVAAWMETTLYDAHAGLFRAAQGTLVVQDGRPVLTSAERARMQGGGHARFPAPHIVAVCPTAGNARAAAALLRFQGGGSAAVRHRAVGARVLEVLEAARRDTGHLPHDFALDPDGTPRAARVDFLADYAELGLALLGAPAMESPGSARSRLVTARALADTLLARFAAAPPGAFYEAAAPDASAPERLRLRLAPLADNARASQFLLELSAATGERRGREAALGALTAWSWSVRSQSAWPGAVYGTAVLAALRPSQPHAKPQDSEVP